MDSIRNVYCVGRNYGLHAAELGNAVPESPMIFMKPTHAVVPMDGSVLTLPSGYGSIHYEAELVVRMGRDYEQGATAGEMIEAFALGIDLTLRDLQDELKKKQHPWLKAKGFCSSAPLTPFRQAPAMELLVSEQFELRINGERRQHGCAAEMIFDLQMLIDHIGEHYGLRTGDLIFTGTPAGVGPVKHGDRMQLYWGTALLGESRLEIG